MTTETLQPTENGSAPSVSDGLPVSTFKAAAPYLRRPFTVNAVKWKVQTAFDDGGLIVAYIDARLVADRLNLVCPSLWQDEYHERPGGMLCEITMTESRWDSDLTDISRTITRRDFGEGYKGKGLYSDAFKRAAVKFGVGVSLYAIPAISLRVGEGLRKKKDGKLQLTKQGEDRCRAMYAKWLADHGIDAFGEPLDHGDSEGSVGDAEMIEAPEPDAGAVTDAIAKQIVDRAWKVADAKNNFQLAVSHQLREDAGDCSTKPKAITAVKLLDLAQAEKLSEWVSKKEADDGK